MGKSSGHHVYDHGINLPLKMNRVGEVFRIDPRYSFADHLMLLSARQQ